jgi:hypothetical protein
LPRGHPDALKQIWEKIEAQAALDQLQRDLPGLSCFCRTCDSKAHSGVGC